MAVEDEGIATETSAPSFESIAAGVLAEPENPTETVEQAETPADAPAVDAGDLEAELDDVDGEEAVKQLEQADGDSILDALKDINRDDLTPDQQAIYDRLEDARKNMQTDYVRKTQKVAETSKSIPEQVAEQVEARLAEWREQNAPQTVEAPADEADPESYLWSGLGEPITIEQAIEAAGPEGLETYINQKAAVIARREVLTAISQVVSPQLSQVNQFVTEQQSSQVNAIIESFAKANPDIAEAENGVDTAIKLVQAGLAKDLDDAGEKVRSMLFGSQQVQQAAEVGFKAGAARKASTTDAQTRFSVPSGSTAPKGPAGSKLKGMSFDQISAAVLTGEAEDV